MRRGVIAGTAAACLLLGAMPAASVGLPGGHIAWADVDNSWTSEAVTFDVNGDGRDDAIVAGGDRLQGYFGAVPGPPWFAAHMAHDTVRPQQPRIKALDGLSGEPLWQVSLIETGESGPLAARTEKRHIEDLHLGDVDGDGDTDLLVLSTGYAFGTNRAPRQITTVYDPRSGKVVWERAVLADSSAHYIHVRAYSPMVVEGKHYGVISQLTAPQNSTFNANVDVVAAPRNAPFEQVASLAVQDGITDALVHQIDGKPRIFLFNHHRVNTPSDDARMRIRALDVTPAATGLQFSERWNRKSLVSSGYGTLGLPSYVIDGPRPLLVTGENSLMARDALTGEPLWRSESAWLVNGMGDAVLHDVNRDGTDDMVIASGTVWFTDPPAYQYSPTITAVNGKDGTLLWKRADHVGETDMLAVTKADIDGDGQVEAIASMYHRDMDRNWTSSTEDPGLIGVYDIATGAQKCRFSMDRMVWALDTGRMDAAAGQEILAPTVAGTTFAFRAAQPGCGVLANGPS